MRLVGLTCLAGILALAGCAETEDFVQSVDEVAAEQHINSFVDALRDQDYEAACDKLTPAGYYHLVTGEVRNFPDREMVDCARKLELVIASSNADLSSLPRVEVVGAKKVGGEIVIESRDGEEWRVMPDDYKITRVPR